MPLLKLCQNGKKFAKSGHTVDNIGLKFRSFIREANRVTRLGIFKNIGKKLSYKISQIIW